jgi:hypothetical protein
MEANSSRPLQLEPKSVYESDLDYWIRKHFGGSSSGRRLKRVVLKFGIIQLVCGVVLIIITGCENELFREEPHISSTTYGASVLSLMFLISITMLLLCAISMATLRFWTSLTTNKKLLVLLARSYAIICFPVFIFLLWGISVLFLAFQNADWYNDALLQLILPYYVVTILVVLFALVAFLYYILDLSYLCISMHYYATYSVVSHYAYTLADEAQRRDSVVGEPMSIVHNETAHWDLSYLEPREVLSRLCATPLGCFANCFSVVSTLAAHGYNESGAAAYGRQTHEQAVPGRHTTAAPSQPRIFSIMWSDWLQYLDSWQPPRQAARVQPEVYLSEVRLPDDRRRSSMQKLGELVKNKSFDVEEEGGTEDMEALRLRRVELEARDAAIMQEEKDTHARRQGRKKKEGGEGDAATVLRVSMYKALWSGLEPAGSFQCKLKQSVSSFAFSEHLREQGFHVVFSSNPSPSESEVGICNIRRSGTEPWFLARFLFSANALSVVMKAQDTSLLKEYVRNFALAKILLIDTEGTEDKG